MFAKYKKKILFSLLIGVVIYLALSLFANIDDLIIAFENFNWLYYPLLLILAFLNYIFRFFKWQYYLYVLDIKLKLSKSFLIFLSAFVMSVTPGKLGEVLKSFLLKEENETPISKSAPIVLAERLTDFISIIMLCLIGAFVFEYGREFIIIIGVLFVLMCVIISIRKLSLKIIFVLGKVKLLKKHTEKLLTAYESIYKLIRIKPLIFALLISIISWFFECIAFYIILELFSAESSVNINILSATFIYGFSTLIGALAMLPGGLGLTEASITGLLVLMKIPKSISVAATLIIRTATLWFAVVVGIIALAFYQKILKKK
ncbi:MAG: flippase-like domain-containing protein [Ignavibacteria bacterium]|nr:flippase-like domain-containing protein [Ignavibacteria bacterium]